LQSYILIQNCTKLLYFGEKKNKKTKNHTVGTILKSNIIIDTPNTQIHDRSQSGHGTCTLIIKGGEV